MYKGNNPVAMRSQSAIRHALLKLLEKKAFNKISIKEINEEADLARQTFYLSFSSKEEVLEYHLDDLFFTFSENIRKEDFEDIEGLSNLFFIFFETHKKMLKLLFDNELQSIVSKKFFEQISQLNHEFNLFKLESEAACKYTLRFLCGAMVEVLSVWTSDQDVEAKELSAIINKILVGIVI